MRRAGRNTYVSTCAHRKAQIEEDDDVGRVRVGRRRKRRRRGQGIFRSGREKLSAAVFHHFPQLVGLLLGAPRAGSAVSNVKVNSNPDLSRAIAERLGLELSKVSLKKFSNQETRYSRYIGQGVMEVTSHSTSAWRLVRV